MRVVGPHHDRAQAQARCVTVSTSPAFMSTIYVSSYVLASASPGVRAQAATPSACGHLVQHEGISYCMSALPYVSSASAYAER